MKTKSNKYIDYVVFYSNLLYIQYHIVDKRKRYINIYTLTITLNTVIDLMVMKITQYLLQVITKVKIMNLNKFHILKYLLRLLLSYVLTTSYTFPISPI